jgi:hypothetical protein
MRMTAIIIGLLLSATVTFAQGKPSDPLDASREPATKSLETFRQLVTERNYQAMGFTSADEVKSATLGEPLLTYFVRLDRLREYQPTTDPNTMLSGGDEVIYPIQVGQQVRSSIRLTQHGGSWQAVSFGGPRLSRALFEARARQAAAPATSYMAVAVPALNLQFLGVKAGQKLTLISLQDNPRAKLTAGSALPAEQVFASLVPLAKDYNGLPM